MHLEKLAAETASSISDYGSLIGHNLIFGAIVGIVLGLIRYKRLRSNEGLQWMLETVVSPTGYLIHLIGTCINRFIANPSSTMGSKRAKLSK